MTDRALRDELMTLLVAGQETSAILLGWAGALLAHHPGVQARVAAEVARLDGLPTMDQLKCVLMTEPLCRHCLKNESFMLWCHRLLPELQCVLLECMRVLPPAYMVGRCAAEATTLACGGNTYSLPQGSGCCGWCVVCAQVTHRIHHHMAFCVF